MKINKISIQNFYSIKNIELELDTYSGLVLIKGKNLDTGGSNGSGKSAIIEAVCWGLTGKTIRKSTEDALINFKSKRNCVVEITLNDDYVIRRSKKPTKLEFFKGKEALTKEGVIETQKTIDATFKISYKTLMVSMFFGQHNNFSFLDASPDDKRIIIRNFLNLDEVFSMRDKIRNFKSNFNQQAKTSEALIKEHSSGLKELEDKIRSINEDKEEYNYSEDFSGLTLESIIATENKNRNIDESIKSISSDLFSIGKEKDPLVYKITKGSGEYSDRCGSCGNIKVKEITENDIEHWEGELTNLEKYIAQKEIEIALLREQKSSLKISSDDWSKFNEYKNLCEKEALFLEMIDDVQDKIYIEEEIKKDSINQYEVMRFWETAFSEKGLIKYVIRNVLQFFNEKSNYYLSYLTDNKYFIEFDEELIEKITTNGGFIHYISLSGGEKRKINLAILLAMKDLLHLTDSEDSNLLFFDEVAENIDKEGIAGLYQLLQEIKKDKTIFIITHNKELKTLLDSVPRISIMKHKGTSTLSRR